jgi:hypothetical protein
MPKWLGSLINYPIGCEALYPKLFCLDKQYQDVHEGLCKAKEAYVYIGWEALTIIQTVGIDIIQMAGKPDQLSKWLGSLINYPNGWEA